MSCDVGNRKDDMFLHISLRPSFVAISHQVFWDRSRLAKASAIVPADYLLEGPAIRPFVDIYANEGDPLLVDSCLVNHEVIHVLGQIVRLRFGG